MLLMTYLNDFIMIWVNKNLLLFSTSKIALLIIFACIINYFIRIQISMDKVNYNF